MTRQKKSKFKNQEHYSFIDWFIVVPGRIVKSGLQIVIKIYGHHFYTNEPKEHRRLIEVAQKHINEKIMRTDAEVYWNSMST